MHFYIFVPLFSFFDSLFLLLNSHSSIFISQIFNSHSSKSENGGAKIEIGGMRIEKCTICWATIS